MSESHIHSAFNDDIVGLRALVQSMGELVERQVTRAADAVLYGDLRRVVQVLEDEYTVNRMQVYVDLQCNQLIALRQPLAGDLREVLAAIHTVNDLERIGDEAKKIALRTRDIKARGIDCPIPVTRIHDMAEQARHMLIAALQGVAQQDASVAAELNAQDQLIDALRDKLQTELLAQASSSPDVTLTAVDMVLIVQSIERIADHAKNIAEYVVNVVEGVDRRHGMATSPG